MIWTYRFVDIVATVSQVLLSFVIISSFCRYPKRKYVRWLLPVFWIVLIYFWTWIIVDGAWKVIVQAIIIIFSCLIIYKDCAFNIIISTLMAMILNGAFESFSLIIGRTFITEMTVNVQGITFAALPVYITCIFANVIATLFVFYLLRNFRYQLQRRDFAIALTFEIVVLLIFNHSVERFVSGFFSKEVALVILTLAISFLVVFLYIKNIYYLREQEQRDKMQIAQLQQQFVYYQEKMKDEERVRAIYHDLKNHLLVMESRQNTEETRQMAQTLRSQIEDYEDYVHTGNDFLDIILKDKAAKAREKQIDFSAMVDFNGIDFIEPLDISTIFGNAIDNAIEASEKLPEERRLVTVRAERVRDMLLIAVENNILPGTQATKGTTKKDRFVHGFGIPNIRKAVEKYGGQCNFQQEERTYRLKILIPIP